MAKRPLLCSKGIRLESREQYVKTFVWAAAFYRLEAWTIRKTDQKRIEAFETWCWRRTLQIKWTEKVRNEEVYRRIGEERTMWNTIRQRISRWVGHVVKDSHCMQSIMEGKIEGKAPGGRPRDKYLGKVKKDAGKKRHGEVKKIAWDGKEWRAAVILGLLYYNSNYNRYSAPGLRDDESNISKPIPPKFRALCGCWYLSASQTSKPMSSGRDYSNSRSYKY
jgi:hypothetical protein